jgi:LacI family transcriptional regulator
MTDGRRQAPTPRAGRADIRQVAAEAGVSIATVSRALSGRGPVSEVARRRVLEVAGRLRYTPRAAAQSLRTDRSMTVGVLVPDLANPVFVALLRGVQHAAQALGYSVLVVDGQRSAEIERLALSRLLAQRVDAVLLAGAPRGRAAIEELERSGTPVVELERVSASGTTAAELERPGTAELCEALAGLGHRRLAFVVNRGGGGVLRRQRWADIQTGCQQLGLQPELVALAGRDLPEEIGDLLEGLVRRADPVSAVVCSTHALAPALLGAMWGRGIDVPRECSFVTFGDSEWAEACRPGISAVALDLYAVAVAVTRAGLTGADVAGEDSGREDEMALPPGRFVRRGSVGPAPRPGAGGSAGRSMG